MKPFNTVRCFLVGVIMCGLFHVTLSRESLTPGKPCLLGVRSLGAGSNTLLMYIRPYFFYSVLTILGIDFLQPHVNEGRFRKGEH
ncbi:MAG TPA: hypothetical protein P5026_05790 [Kiritimatiellia bacterium]|nr:hypothetical protein [Kiritimatiellia bacterium]